MSSSLKKLEDQTIVRTLTDEITSKGGRAVCAAVDVSNQDDVRAIAEKAKEAYGGFDTWINNAGVFLYGTLDKTPIEDMRRLFETNVWGLVYGSLEAVEHLKLHGGALINVGSVLSDRAIMLQGIYFASKHAVKGFTDALRRSLRTRTRPSQLRSSGRARLTRRTPSTRRTSWTNGPRSARPPTPPTSSRARSSTAPSTRSAT